MRRSPPSGSGSKCRLSQLGMAPIAVREIAAPDHNFADGTRSYWLALGIPKQ